MEQEKTAQEKVKPNYYQADNGIEVFDVLEMFEITDHYIASAMTYLFRAGKKEGESQADDINKAIKYLQRKVSEERNLIISLQPLPPTMKYILQTVETQPNDIQLAPKNHEAEVVEEVGVEEFPEQGNEVLGLYKPETEDLTIYDAEKLIFDADKFKSAVEGQNLN